MANGRNRRQVRSALNRRARLQRFPGIGSYDYGPAAVITADFGQIARDNLSDFRNVQETARKARERLDAAQKEAQEAQDYEYTGIANVDQATMAVATDYRNHLREERNKIGQLQDDGSVYTISDFVAFKNNVINNSKIWKGHPELINKTLERMRDDKTLDPIAIEAYAETAGLILNPGGSYTIRSSRDPQNKGDIIITGKGPDDKDVEFDLKTLAVNGVQEVKNFDTEADIKDFQNIYAKTQQTFDIEGKTYTSQEVADNPLLLIKHLKTEPKEFLDSKEKYINNFSEDDQKVISYLRQMGKDVEYDHSAYDSLSDADKDNFDKIYLNKKGRFVVSDKLREEARKDFKARVDGAFGIEEKVDVRVLNKGNQGTAKPIKLPTIDPLNTIVTDSKNNPQKPGQLFGVTDYRDAFNRSMDPNKKEIPEDIPGRETIEIDQPFINLDTFGKMEEEHKARNSDIFTPDGGVLMYGYGGTQKQIEDQIDKGNIDQVGFSMGLNLSKTQLDALNITATKPGRSKSLGARFSSINGISFTFDRRRLTDEEKKKMKASKTLNELNNSYNINDYYPMRIKGAHLIGPADTRVQQKVEGGRGSQPNASGSMISVETKDTAVKEAGNLTISDLVSESQIPQLVEMIGKENPVFEQLYKDAMRQQGAYPVKALYDAVQKAQSMQNQLVTQ